PLRLRGGGDPRDRVARLLGARRRHGRDDAGPHRRREALRREAQRPQPRLLLSAARRAVPRAGDRDRTARPNARRATSARTVASAPSTFAGRGNPADGFARRPHAVRCRDDPARVNDGHAAPRRRGRLGGPVARRSQTGNRMRISHDAYTDTGRRSNNEDAYLAAPALGLYAVADGMGGYEGGEVASRIAL